MADYEPLIFEDISIAERPVKIAGQDYVLRAANGDVACQYKNMASSLYRVNQDTKETFVKGAGDLEPFLVSLCLFKVNGPGMFERVHITHVKNFPAAIIKSLFDAAKEFGGLTEDVSLEALKKQRAELDNQIAELEKGTAKNEQ
jgi:hypothetical protein